MPDNKDLNAYLNRALQDPFSLGATDSSFDYGQNVNNRDYLNGGFTFMSPYDVDELRATKQPWSHKFARGVSRFGTKTLAEVLKMPGVLGGIAAGALGQIGDAFSGEDNTDFVQTAFNNTWIRAIEDAEEYMNHEALPVYVRKAVQEGNLWDNISSVDFWATEGADGLGYIVSMLLPGQAITSLNLGSKMFGGLSRGAAKMAKSTSNATNKMAKLGRTGVPVGATSEDLATATIANTLFEAGAEARGAMDALEQEIDYRASLPSNHPDYLSPEAAQEERAKVSTVGANVFGANALILIGPNAITSKILWGGKLNKAPKFKVNSEGMKELAEPSFLQKVKTWGDNFGIGALREGFWEEGMQTTAEKYFTENPDANLFDFAKDAPEKWYDNLGTTEGQKAIFLGAVFGGPMQASINTYKEGKDRERTNQLLGTGNNLFDEFTTLLGNNNADTEVEDENGEMQKVYEKGKDGVLRPKPDPVKVRDQINSQNQMEVLAGWHTYAVQTGDQALQEYVEDLLSTHLVQGFVSNDVLGLETLRTVLEQNAGFAQAVEKTNKDKQATINRIMEKAQFMQDYFEGYKEFAPTMIKPSHPEALPKDFPLFSQKLLAKYLTDAGTLHYLQKLKKKQLESLRKVYDQGASQNVFSFEDILGEDNQSKSRDARQNPRIAKAYAAYKDASDQEAKVQEKLESYWEKAKTDELFERFVKDSRELEARLAKEEKVQETLDKIDRVNDEDELDKLFDELGDELDADTLKVLKDAAAKKKEALKKKEATTMSETFEKNENDQLIEDINKITKEDAIKQLLSQYSEGELITVPEGVEHAGETARIVRVNKKSVRVALEDGDTEFTIHLDKVYDYQKENGSLYSVEGGGIDSVPEETRAPFSAKDKNQDKRYDSVVMTTNASDGFKLFPFISPAALTFERNPVDKTGKRVYFEIPKAGKLMNDAQYKEALGELEKLRDEKIDKYYEEGDIVNPILAHLRDQIVAQTMMTPSEKKEAQKLLKLLLTKTNQTQRAIIKKLNEKYDITLSYKETEIDRIHKEFFAAKKVLDSKTESSKLSMAERKERNKLRREAEDKDKMIDLLNGIISNLEPGQLVQLPSHVKKYGGKVVTVVKVNQKSVRVQYKEELNTITTKQLQGAPEGLIDELSKERDALLQKADAIGVTVEFNPDTIKSANVRKAWDMFNAEDFSDIEFLIDYLPIMAKLTKSVGAPLHTKSDNPDAEGFNKNWERTTRNMRETILREHIENGVPIEKIFTEIAGQKNGTIKMDESVVPGRVPENGIQDLYEFDGNIENILFAKDKDGNLTKTKAYLDRFFVVNERGVLENIRNTQGRGKITKYLVNKDYAAPGEIYLQIHTAAGKPFFLKLNVKRVAEREAEVLWELYNFRFDDLEKGKDTNITALPKDVYAKVTENMQEELDLMGKPLEDVTIKDIIDFFIWDGTKKRKSQVRFYKKKLLVADKEYSKEEFQSEQGKEDFINDLVNMKRRHIRIRKRKTGDDQYVQTMQNVDYVRYLLRNRILNTNAVVNEPTFQDATNVYLKTFNVRIDKGNKKVASSEFNKGERQQWDFDIIGYRKLVEDEIPELFTDVPKVHRSQLFYIIPGLEGTWSRASRFKDVLEVEDEETANPAAATKIKNRKENAAKRGEVTDRLTRFYFSKKKLNKFDFIQKGRDTLRKVNQETSKRKEGTNITMTDNYFEELYNVLGQYAKYFSDNRMVVFSNIPSANMEIGEGALGRFAGTIDLLVYDTKSKTFGIIDLKTTGKDRSSYYKDKNDKYQYLYKDRIQQSAYKKMYEEKADGELAVESMQIMALTTPSSSDINDYYDKVSIDSDGMFLNVKEIDIEKFFYSKFLPNIRKSKGWGPNLLEGRRKREAQRADDFAAAMDAAGDNVQRFAVEVLKKLTGLAQGKGFDTDTENKPKKPKKKKESVEIGEIKRDATQFFKDNATISDNGVELDVTELGEIEHQKTGEKFIIAFNKGYIYKVNKKGGLDVVESPKVVLDFIQNGMAPALFTLKAGGLGKLYQGFAKNANDLYSGKNKKTKKTSKIKKKTKQTGEDIIDLSKFNDEFISEMSDTITDLLEEKLTSEEIQRLEETYDQNPEWTERQQVEEAIRRLVDTEVSLEEIKTKCGI